jgi:hypothetical protein
MEGNSWESALKPYNECMARGWESKSVEGQVQDHQEDDGKNRSRQSTPEQSEARRQREVLLLSRSRVQKSLEVTQNSQYREQLNRALADLESQLAKLDAKK